MFNFELVDQVVTDTSNCVFGRLDTKKNVQRNLMLTIQMACIEYSNNADFKRKIDLAAEQYRSI